MDQIIIRTEKVPLPVKNIFPSLGDSVVVLGFVTSLGLLLMSSRQWVWSRGCTSEQYGVQKVILPCHFFSSDIRETSTRYSALKAIPFSLNFG